MQISLNIQDDVYQKLVNAGIDMQSKVNDYLISLVSKKDIYIDSQQFQEDRAYFQQALEDIEGGKTQVVSHSDVWDKIEKHTNK
jgi:predicted CopG family antitoxin